MSAVESFTTASHWGVVKAIVEDGIISRLEPFEFDESPSPNLNSLAELPYSESRIKTPMVRASFLKDYKSSGSSRGSDEFVPVSWDEAIDLAASHINRIYDEYGPESVWGRSYGWMSPGKVNSAVSLVRRLLSLRGGFIQTENTYSTGAISKILPYVVGSSSPKPTSWEIILKHSQRMVFWGSDPLTTNDIDWSTTLHNSAPYFEELAASGIKTYSINPIRTQTCKKLDSEWIAVRPGTDCALILGMIHHLICIGKVDYDFLEKYTSGSQELIDYATGKKDGVAKTPEWAELECGVPADKIRSFAEDLADHRTMLALGWGPQRARYGEQPCWMLIALASMLGQIGLPGGGFGTTYHYCSGGSPEKDGPFLPGIPGFEQPVFESKKKPKERHVLPVARLADVLANPGKEIDFNGKRVKYPDVKLVFWAGGNPFAHHPDSFNLLKAWRNPEVVIAVDSVWSATAKCADIVLPACTSFERADITSIGSFTNDGVAIMEKVVEPMWSSKSDYEIFSLLADRLGIAEEFTLGRSEEEWIEHLYETCRSNSPRHGFEMPSFAEFKQTGVFLYPKKKGDESFVSMKDFRDSPIENPLSTETGRIVLYSEKIASFNYDDCPGHPVYMKFAKLRHGLFNLVSPKSRWRLHSQLGCTNSSRLASEENGRETVLINELDAAERGISEGDLVLIKNECGSVFASARPTKDIVAGCMAINHGAWLEISSTADSCDNHGAANVLVPDLSTSRLAQGNNANSSIVDVVKSS